MSGKLCCAKFWILGLGLILALSQVANADLSTKLVSYWRLDSNLLDDSPRALALTATGPTVAASGYIASCYQFTNTDPADRDIMYYSGDYTTGSLTFTAWINPSVLETGVGDTATHPHTVGHFYRSGGAAVPDVKLAIRDGNLEASFINTGTTVVLPTTLNIPTNQWTFVAVTLGGSALTAYKNDEAPQTIAVPGLPTLPYNRALIGYNAATATAARGLTGRIDELRLYNRELTATDIADLYAQETGRDASMQAYWRLNGNLLSSTSIIQPTLTNIGTSLPDPAGKIDACYLINNTDPAVRQWVYMSYAAGFGMMGELTVTGWINPSVLESGVGVTATHPHTIVHAYKSSGTNPRVSLVIEDGKLVGRYIDTAAAKDVSLATNLTVPVDEWTFVALKLSSTNLTVYKNNEAPQTIAHGATLTTALLNRVMLGLNLASVTDARGLTGRLDEFRLYRSALSDGQIAGIYDAEVPVELSAFAVE